MFGYGAYWNVVQTQMPSAPATPFNRVEGIIPYSGYFSGGNNFVVFVVERQTTKYLPTKNTACARLK